VRGWWLVVIVLLAGCLDAKSGACGDGTTCRPGTVCVAALQLCATPEQISACQGANEGAHCRTSVIPDGTCTNGACIALTCGDGVVEVTEACDDGNTLSGDGCSADCKSNESCGNGITDLAVGEECDCGEPNNVNPACTGPNSDDGGTCNLACKYRCGDGIIEADEGCDPAVSALAACASVPGSTFDRGVAACSPSCQPVVANSCKYIGWRTKLGQPSRTIIGIAPTGPGTGYWITATNIAAYSGYMPTSTLGGVSLTAIWVSDQGHPVAVGDSVVRGPLLTPEDVSAVTTSPLTGVWGRDDDDVYAIGDATLIHWNGSAWSAVTLPASLPTFRAVAGDAQNVYIACDGGKIVVYDDTADTWQTITTATTEDLHAIWTVPGLTVAVGDHGAIVQNAGSGWVLGSSPATDNLTSVWGDPNDATSGVFAVGDSGTVLFFDGRAWRPMSLGRGVTGPVNQRLVSLRGVSGSSGFTELLALGTSEIMSYEGAAWSPTFVPTNNTIDGLWASATDDIYAVGRNGTILHNDGLAWTIEAVPNMTPDLHAVWGTSSTDVYAVGDDLTILHNDGSGWTIENSVPGGGSFTAVFGVGGHVYVAGTNGVSEYNAGLMSAGASPPTSVNALAGLSSTGVFAGSSSGIWQLAGSTWTQTNVTDPVRAMSSTTSKIFAIGASAHEYGTPSWPTATFFAPSVQSIAAAADDSVFLAGDSGALLHWDATALEPLKARTTVDLHAVLVIGKVVVVAGLDGTLDMMVFHR